MHFLMNFYKLAKKEGWIKQTPYKEGQEVMQVAKNHKGEKAKNEEESVKWKAYDGHNNK